MHFKKKSSIIVYTWQAFGPVLKYHPINKYVCSRRFFFQIDIDGRKREHTDLMTKLIVNQSNVS